MLKCFKDKDFRVQQAACDALFNIIKIVREAILDNKEIFKSIFDSVIDMMYDNTNSKSQDADLKDWAKSVDDLLKNQVYNALSRGHPFDLESLIKYISEKLKVTVNHDVIIVLIKWLEVLHSISNVNILPSVPKFLDKLLQNIDNKNQVNQKTEVSKKSVELLSVFIEEFSHPMSRSVKLDQKIIKKLLQFLLKDKNKQGGATAAGGTGGNAKYDMIVLDSSKREALLWLREFIQHFQEDYMAWAKSENE